ncbi:MAG: hypothetical protein RLZZ338_1428 [Cyanobacteriota bacterium]|jgi:adenine-specific DNA-methyltransferase
MKTVFVHGSRSISVLPQAAINSLDKIMELNFHIIVGQCPGLETEVVNYLAKNNYQNLTVIYCKFDGSGSPKFRELPHIGLPGGYRVRNWYMTAIADYGLAIWDSKSKYTKQNIDAVPLTRVIAA